MVTCCIADSGLKELEIVRREGFLFLPFFLYGVRLTLRCLS